MSNNISFNPQDIPKFLQENLRNQEFEKELDIAVNDTAFREAFIHFAQMHPQLMEFSPVFNRTFENIKELDLSKLSEDNPTVFEFQGVSSFINIAKRIYNLAIGRFPIQLKEFEQRLLTNPEQINDELYGEDNPALMRKKLMLVCAYAEAGLFDLKMINKELKYIVHISFQGNFEKIKEMTPFLEKLTESNPELLFQILSIKDNDKDNEEYPFFGYLKTVKAMTPIFEKLADSNPELLIKMLSIQGKNGPSLGYLEIVKAITPFLEKLADSNPELLVKTFAIEDKKGESFFCYVEAFKAMTPFLEKLADSNPELLIKILSKQNKYGSSFFVYSEAVKAMTPIFEKLADSNPELLVKILSIQNKYGSPFFVYSEAFKAMTPFLEKLVDSNPEFLIEILSIKDNEGRLFFRYSEAVKAMTPFLNKLADSNPELLIKILSIQNNKGSSFYSYPSAVVELAPMLKKLKEHHPDHLTELREKLAKGLLGFKDMNPDIYESIWDDESSKISKEYSNRNILTHVAEIDLLSVLKRRTRVGKSSIASEGFTYEGSYSHRNYKKIESSLHTFSQMIPEKIPSDLKDCITETIESNKKINKSAVELFERWKSGKPILIDAGFPSHYVSILVWENKLIINNRGSGVVYIDKLPKTSLVYSFDPSKFDLSVIEKIHAVHESGDLNAYNDLVKTQLKNLIELNQTEQDLTIQKHALPTQIIGNCGMANAEAGVKNLINLYMLRQVNKNVGEIEPEQAENILGEVDRIFTDWEASFILKTLTSYLKWVRNPNNHFIPDFERVYHTFWRLETTGGIDKRLKVECAKLRNEWEEELEKVKKEENPHTNFMIHNWAINPHSADIEKFQKELINNPVATVAELNKEKNAALFAKKFMVLCTHAELGLVDFGKLKQEIIIYGRMSQLLPFFASLAQSDPNFLMEILSNQDKYGHSFLAYSKPVKAMTPFLEKLAKSNSELLIKILSIQNQFGDSFFAYLDKLEVNKAMTTLFEKLAKSNSELLIKILSIQNKNGDSFFRYVQTIKAMIPFFEKLAKSAPQVLLEIFSIKNKEGLPILSESKKAESMKPFLESLAQSNPELFAAISSIQNESH